ncbi:MAG: GIY-YIG nuclease family protein [Planctomycetota bacterium]
MQTWHVYLLRTDRGALYTGIATDVERRLQTHRRRTRAAARYTRACQTLELVYRCPLGDRSLASRVEARIKALDKSRKEALVAQAPDGAALLRLLGLAAA